jgi:hypothetical protein
MTDSAFRLRTFRGIGEKILTTDIGKGTIWSLHSRVKIPGMASPNFPIAWTMTLDNTMGKILSELFTKLNQDGLTQ